MLLNVGSGGGAAAAPSGGAAGAAAEAPPEEVKKEEKEEGKHDHSPTPLFASCSDMTCLNREGGVRRGHGSRSFRLRVQCLLEMHYLNSACERGMLNGCHTLYSVPSGNFYRGHSNRYATG